ncbi:MAG: hypothetical protein K5696_02225 [Lachnospiraceae bacterium]|nr:hypothetical protein [Lachnospiraceae bacterium]
MINQEKAFGETLARIRREARENGGMITTKRIREAFGAFSLDEKQLEEVIAYLRESHIGVDQNAPDAEEYLSEQERDYLSDYLASLEELPVLDAKEKEQLALRATAGNAQAQDRLAQGMLRMIPDIARLYVQQGVLLEDLIGEGNVALMQGVTLLGALSDASDGQDDVGFEADAALTRYIMDAMENYIAENLQEDARGQRAVNRVNEVADRAKELYADLRRPVTVEELMNETGWSREKILDAWKLAGGKIEELEVKKEDVV